VKGWKVWQRNRNKHQRPAELRGVKAEEATAVTEAGGAKADRVALVRAAREVPVDGREASGNISGRRKCASSASRRWT